MANAFVFACADESYLYTVSAGSGSPSWWQGRFHGAAANCLLALVLDLGQQLVYFAIEADRGANIDHSVLAVVSCIDEGTDSW